MHAAIADGHPATVSQARQIADVVLPRGAGREDGFIRYSDPRRYK